MTIQAKYQRNFRCAAPKKLNCRRDALTGEEAASCQNGLHVGSVHTWNVLSLSVAPLERECMAITAKETDESADRVPRPH